MSLLILFSFACFRDCCPRCVDYYRKIITFVPGSFALLALVALATLIPQTLGTRRKKGGRSLQDRFVIRLIKNVFSIIPNKFFMISLLSDAY